LEMLFLYFLLFPRQVYLPLTSCFPFPPFFPPKSGSSLTPHFPSFRRTFVAFESILASTTCQPYPHYFRWYPILKRRDIPYRAAWVDNRFGTRERFPTHLSLSPHFITSSLFRSPPHLWDQPEEVLERVYCDGGPSLSALTPTPIFFFF